MSDEFFSEDLPIHGAMNGLGDGGRSERRDAVENRQRILTVAAHLFAQHGVENVHMAQIAEAAGVGKGTLYRRFANKADLCLALMHDQLVQHQEETLTRLRQMAADGVPALDRLGFFLAEVVAFSDHHAPLLGEVQQELSAGPEGDSPFFEWQSMTVYGLLQAAVRAGEVSEEIDLPITVDMLLAPLVAAFFRYLCHQRGFSTARIRDGLLASVERLRKM